MRMLHSSGRHAWRCKRALLGCFLDGSCLKESFRRREACGNLQMKWSLIRVIGDEHMYVWLWMWIMEVEWSCLGNQISMVTCMEFGSCLMNKYGCLLFLALLFIISCLSWYANKQRSWDGPCTSESRTTVNKHVFAWGTLYPLGTHMQSLKTFLQGSATKSIHNPFVHPLSHQSNISPTLYPHILM